MADADQLLTSAEVAQFVAEGFLRFDALVPEEINERAVEEMRALMPVKMRLAIGVAPDEDWDRPQSGCLFSECYPAPSALGEYLRLPRVQGIVESLVGPDPIYDHDFVHYLPAGSGYEQHLHVDAIVDSGAPTFDIQVFYFPREVEEGAGGTRFLPGSHLRIARAEGVSRYQHIRGEQQFAGPAGTVLVFHHGMWHAGQPNPSAEDRWMHKIRLNPRVSQQRHWRTDDLDTFQNDPSDHIFATMRFDSVGNVLRKMQPWQIGHEARSDLVQRTRLWRYLTGETEYDVDYYLTRLEQRARLLEEPGA
jgi:hypothetical protein